MIKRTAYKLLTCGFPLIIQNAIVKGQKVAYFLNRINFYNRQRYCGFLDKTFFVA